MLLSLYVTRLGHSHYRVVICDGDAVLNEFETPSIGAAFQRATEVQVKGLEGFSVWFDGIYTGSIGLSSMIMNPEGAVTQMISYRGRGHSDR